MATNSRNIGEDQGWSTRGTEVMETSHQSNRLVSHKIRSKDCKEEISFILNGRATVQGEGHNDYHTE